MHGGSLFSKSLPIFICCHFVTAILTSLRWYLIVILTYISLMLSIFSCICWPSKCLLWQNIYSGPLPNFKLLLQMLSYTSSLYILDINPLFDVLFPGGSVVKKLACNTGDLGLILGWEDSLEEGMATHSSILACTIPMDRETWLVTVHGVTKSWTWLSN